MTLVEDDNVIQALTADSSWVSEVAQSTVSIYMVPRRDRPVADLEDVPLQSHRGLAKLMQRIPGRLLAKDFYPSHSAEQEP
jgi:hypothetical protein